MSVMSMKVFILLILMLHLVRGVDVTELHLSTNECDPAYINPTTHSGYDCSVCEGMAAVGDVMYITCATTIHDGQLKHDVTHTTDDVTWLKDGVARTTDDVITTTHGARLKRDVSQNTNDVTATTHDARLKRDVTHTTDDVITTTHGARLERDVTENTDDVIATTHGAQLNDDVTRNPDDDVRNKDSDIGRPSSLQRDAVRASFRHKHTASAPKRAQNSAMYVDMNRNRTRALDLSSKDERIRLNRHRRGLASEGVNSSAVTVTENHTLMASNQPILHDKTSSHTLNYNFTTETTEEDTEKGSPTLSNQKTLELNTNHLTSNNNVPTTPTQETDKTFIKFQNLTSVFEQYTQSLPDRSSDIHQPIPHPSSNLPSDIPTTIPTDIPTDHPSSIRSTISHNLPSDVPTDHPPTRRSTISHNLPSDITTRDAVNTLPEKPTAAEQLHKSDEASEIQYDVTTSRDDVVRNRKVYDLPSVVPSSFPADLVPSDVISAKDDVVSSDVISPRDGVVSYDVTSPRDDVTSTGDADSSFRTTSRDDVKRLPETPAVKEPFHLSWFILRHGVRIYLSTRANYTHTTLAHNASSGHLHTSSYGATDDVLHNTRSDDVIHKVSSRLGYVPRAKDGPVFTIGCQLYIHSEKLESYAEKRMSICVAATDNVQYFSYPLAYRQKLTTWIGIAVIGLLLVGIGVVVYRARRDTANISAGPRQLTKEQYQAAASRGHQNARDAHTMTQSKTTTPPHNREPFGYMSDIVSGTSVNNENEGSKVMRNKHGFNIPTWTAEGLSNSESIPISWPLEEGVGVVSEDPLEMAKIVKPGAAWRGTSTETNVTTIKDFTMHSSKDEINQQIMDKSRDASHERRHYTGLDKKLGDPLQHKHRKSLDTGVDANNLPVRESDLHHKHRTSLDTGADASNIRVRESDLHHKHRTSLDTDADASNIRVRESDLHHKHRISLDTDADASNIIVRESDLHHKHRTSLDTDADANNIRVRESDLHHKHRKSLDTMAKVGARPNNKDKSSDALHQIHHHHPPGLETTAKSLHGVHQLVDRAKLEPEAKSDGNGTAPIVKEKVLYEIHPSHHTVHLDTLLASTAAQPDVKDKVLHELHPSQHAVQLDAMLASNEGQRQVKEKMLDDLHPSHDAAHLETMIASDEAQNLVKEKILHELHPSHHAVHLDAMISADEARHQRQQHTDVDTVDTDGLQHGQSVHLEKLLSPNGAKHDAKEILHELHPSQHAVHLEAMLQRQQHGDLDTVAKSTDALKHGHHELHLETMLTPNETRHDIKEVLHELHPSHHAVHLGAMSRHQHHDSGPETVVKSTDAVPRGHDVKENVLHELHPSHHVVHLGAIPHGHHHTAVPNIAKSADVVRAKHLDTEVDTRAKSTDALHQKHHHTDLDTKNKSTDVVHHEHHAVHPKTNPGVDVQKHHKKIETGEENKKTPGVSPTNMDTDGKFHDKHAPVDAHIQLDHHGKDHHDTKMHHYGKSHDKRGSADSHAKMVHHAHGKFHDNTGVFDAPGKSTDHHGVRDNDGKIHHGKELEDSIPKTKHEQR